MANNIEKQLLLKLIKASDYTTSKDLAFSLNTSEKTVLKYLNLLKNDLEGNGATLEVKHGYGSTLIVSNQEKFNKYLAQIGTNEVPSTKEERKSYILSRLLATKDYINIYDLADEIYISPSLLRIIFKDLIPIIERYNLEIDHSHNHGYRIVGNEDDIRRCLRNECNDLENIQNLDFLSNYEEDMSTQISSIVAKTLEQYHIAISNEAISSLTLHILIAINRNETNNYIEVDESIVRKINSSAEFYVIRNINKQLTEQYNICLPEVELAYLTLHLSGKQRLIAHEHLQVKIDNDALVFYNKFLRNIYQTYYYDFFEDNELRISLLNHIVPFINRINSNSQITKSSLSGIKNEFPFAYELAISGLSFLNDENIVVLPAEIGYFALHLALSLEKNKTDKNIYNIAIITNELSGIYNMMSYKLTNHLSNSSTTIKYYNTDEAKLLDDNSTAIYDIILNTSQEVFLFNNILNVSTFLNDEELNKIESTLKNNLKNPYINELFNSKTYLQLNSLNTKEEVIKAIINKIKDRFDLSDNFYNLVIDRENIETTEYGNYIAIPHPLKSDCKQEFIAIAKLDKPIIWSEQKVQLVFLINLFEHINVAWFMQRISVALAKENISLDLIKAKNYEEFIEIFKKIS